MDTLTQGLMAFTWQQGVMLLISLLLIYFAIVKEYEPMLLLPMGFGAMLANIPLSSAVGEHGPLTILFNAGIATELFPLLIFVAVGAMIDFGPLLKNPKMLLFGGSSTIRYIFHINNSNFDGVLYEKRQQPLVLLALQMDQLQFM